MSTDSIEKIALDQNMAYGNLLSWPMDSSELHRFVNEAWTESSRTVRIVLIVTSMTVLCFQMTCYLMWQTFNVFKQTPQFTLQGSKCSFGQPSISLLGFQYSLEVVTLMTQKTKSVIDWLTPKSTKEVRSFLVFMNFYRRFIPRFADITAH